jgi:hypothetical protein
MRQIWLMLAISLLMAGVLTPRAAQAQASRTWVSGVGDDANPCSRTAPCKTFAGAISKTAAGGEIDVLDPGGFGGVTLTKAITLDGGSGQVASILVAGTNGITVAAGANDIVVLRNLSINGIASGLNGISYVSGKGLVVEHCNVMGFTSSAINIAPTAGGQATISDSTLENNVNGILFSTAGSSAAIGGLVSRTLVTHNTGIAVGGTGGAGHPGVGVIIDRLVASFNGTGVSSNGASLLLGGSTVIGNATGIAQTGGGSVSSYKNNQINANGTDGTPLSALGLN